MSAMGLFFAEVGISLNFPASSQKSRGSMEKSERREDENGITKQVADAE